MASSNFRPQHFLISNAVALTLSTGCTIGPRTPIEEAPPPQMQAERAPRDTREDDDFHPPAAERVTDDDQQTGQGPADLHHRPTAWGRATGKLGARPPFQTFSQGKSAVSTAGIPLGKTWKLKKSIWVGKGYLHQAAFSQDGESVVTLSGENGEVFHYAMDGKLQKKIVLPDFGQFENVGFAMLKEVTRPQIVVTRRNGTSVVDLLSGKLDHLTLAPAGDTLVHAGPFGLYGVTARSTDPGLSRLVLQWISGEIALDLNCPSGISDWDLSRDGVTLALLYLQDNQVEVVSLKDGKTIAKIPSPRFGSAVALSPTGTHLAVGGEKLVLLDLESGNIAFEDDSYKNNISDIRFTSDGSLLLVSAYDGKARSYTLPADLHSLTSPPKVQLLDHQGDANVYTVELNATENLLVTSSEDKTLKIWER